MTIGELIKIRRKELGLTQDELAKLTGYSGKGAITKIETGVNDLNQTKIKTFAEALQCSPLYLLDIEDPNQFTLTDQEQKLIEEFKKFNEEGQEKILNYINDLAATGLYNIFNQDGVSKKEA